MNEFALKRFVAIFAIIISLILIAVKGLAWHASDSVSLLSSLVDSVIDFFASFLNLIAIYHALKPADVDHRFGHEKIEALAALGQSVFIFGSAFMIFKEALDHFSNPQPIINSTLTITATLISIVLTIVLLNVQKYVIRKTNSLAIQADYAHYKSDLLINIGVLFVISGGHHFQSTLIDPIFGALVALYILASSYPILVSALGILMDKELSNEKRVRIETIIMSHPMISGYHLLRTRSSGTREFIQCHLELPGHITLLEAHHVSQEVESTIRKEFPKADIILHQDPAHIMEDHRSSL